MEKKYFKSILIIVLAACNHGTIYPSDVSPPLREHLEKFVVSREERGAFLDAIDAFERSDPEAVKKLDSLRAKGAIFPEVYLQYLKQHEPTFAKIKNGKKLIDIEVNPRLPESLSALVRPFLDASVVYRKLNALEEASSVPSPAKKCGSKKTEEEKVKLINQLAGMVAEGNVRAISIWKTLLLNRSKLMEKCQNKTLAAYTKDEFYTFWTRMVGPLTETSLIHFSLDFPLLFDFLASPNGHMAQAMLDFKNTYVRYTGLRNQLRRTVRSVKETSPDLQEIQQMQEKFRDVITPKITLISVLQCGLYQILGGEEHLSRVGWASLAAENGFDNYGDLYQAFCRRGDRDTFCYYFSKMAEWLKSNGVEYLSTEQPLGKLWSQCCSSRFASPSFLIALELDYLKKKTEDGTPEELAIYGLALFQKNGATDSELAEAYKCLKKARESGFNVEKAFLDYGLLLPEGVLSLLEEEQPTVTYDAIVASLELNEKLELEYKRSLLQHKLTLNSIVEKGSGHTQEYLRIDDLRKHDVFASSTVMHLWAMLALKYNPVTLRDRAREKLQKAANNDYVPAIIALDKLTKEDEALIKQAERNEARMNQTAKDEAFMKQDAAPDELSPFVAIALTLPKASEEDSAGLIVPTAAAAAAGLMPLAPAEGIEDSDLDVDFADEIAQIIEAEKKMTREGRAQLSLVMSRAAYNNPSHRADASAAQQIPVSRDTLAFINSVFSGDSREFCGYTDDQAARFLKDLGCRIVAPSGGGSAVCAIFAVSDGVYRTLSWHRNHSSGARGHLYIADGHNNTRTAMRTFLAAIKRTPESLIDRRM